MNPSKGTLSLRDARRRFDRAAATFDRVDFVHRSTADELMERLAPIVIDVKRVLDLGGGTGSAAGRLERRFKGAHVVVADASLEMLRMAAAKRSLLSRRSVLQCNATALPCGTGSFDLAYSNLLLPWIDARPLLFAEVARVLRRGGLFIFSTMGPGSLAELRDAWASVDDGEHVNPFDDMHDVGDELVRTGLCDPVLDIDYLNVSYRDTAALFRDLTLLGARNSLLGRAKSLTGKRRFRNMETALERRFPDGVLQLKLELVYGHAWGGGPPQRPGEYRIDAAGIERRRG